jgi:hypothetical protein
MRHWAGRCSVVPVIVHILSFSDPGMSALALTLDWHVSENKVRHDIFLCRPIWVNLSINNLSKH